MKTTYKQIVTNMVDTQLATMLDERCENRYYIVEDIELTNDTMVAFTANVKVKPYHDAPFYNLYAVHGFVNDFGKAIVTYVTFERTTCKRLENGGLTEPSTKTYTVYMESLKDFMFDR